MASLFFDNQSTAEHPNEELEPLWLLDLEDEEDILAWAKRTYDTLAERDSFKNALRRELCARMNGIYLKHEPVVGGARLIGQRQDRAKQFPKIITNHYRSLVEQKVAMQVKYKPATEVQPFSQEYKDKADSIVAKKFLDYIKNYNRVDLLYPRLARRAILMGQSFIFPHWDPTIGDLDGKKTRKIEISRRDGTTCVIEDSPLRKGEARLDFPMPEDVFLFPADNSESVPAVMKISRVSTWDLKVEYPHLQDKIKPTGDLSYWDYNLCDEVLTDGMTIVIEVWYRSCPAVDKGLYLKCTPDVVLREKGEPLVCDNPITPEGKHGLEFGNLPMIRLTDGDVEGEIDGRPSALDLVNLQELYDKLSTHFAMNIDWFCNPKWAVQKNSCDVKQLANIPGLILEYTSPTPPQLQVTNAITQDQFAYRAGVLEGMENTFGVYSISRGAPPPGTRAT